MNEKELLDFANWLWNMDKLKVQQYLPTIENAEYWVQEYIKVKKLNTPQNCTTCKFTNAIYTDEKCCNCNRNNSMWEQR